MTGAARWGIVLAALFVAGIVLAVVGGTTLDAVGLGLAGMAVVGAVSLSFLAVGRSEDRARAEEAERRDDTPPQDGRVDHTRMKRRRDH